MIPVRIVVNDEIHYSFQYQTAATFLAFSSTSFSLTVENVYPISTNYCMYDILRQTSTLLDTDAPG